VTHFEHCLEFDIGSFLENWSRRKAQEKKSHFNLGQVLDFFTRQYSPPVLPFAHWIWGWGGEEEQGFVFLHGEWLNSEMLFFLSHSCSIQQLKLQRRQIICSNA
jgi:hypothetical protein